jgi:hypothetical protein
LSQLAKRLMDRTVEVELTNHLGYEPHMEPPAGAGQCPEQHDAEDADHTHRPVAIDTPQTATAASSRRSSGSTSCGLRDSTHTWHQKPDGT